MDSASHLLLAAGLPPPPSLQMPPMASASTQMPPFVGPTTKCCNILPSMANAEIQIQLPNIANENEKMEEDFNENAAESSKTMNANENVSKLAIEQIDQNPSLLLMASPSSTTFSAAGELANQNSASIKSEVLSMPASNSLPVVIKPPGDEKEERPSLSYKDLIIEAIESSPERRLKLSEIYQVIKYLHPYYQRRADQWGWQNSIRHNLSLHDCFVKLPLKQTSANGVVGHFWTVVHRNPEEKPGPTRRRSRANIGGGNANGGGKGGKKGVHHGLGQSQMNAASAGGKAAKGLKGRQSVSSDSGVMSDDGGMGGGCHSGTQSPMAGGGSASVPLPTLLQIPLQNEPQTMMGKFQPLQSPLAMSSHTPTTLHQFAFQSQAQQNLLSPLELVLNGQNAANLVQSPQQPPLTQIGGQSQFQYSPIPGKTAPAHPQTTLLEQQLQQLLAANATNAAAQMMGPASSSPPHQPQPTTPASAPPTFLGAQSTGHPHPLALMASSLGGTAANDANLSLLSQLASQLLATTSPMTPTSAALPPLGSPSFVLPQPQQTQQQNNNNSLTIAAASAAAELQRLQMLQLYAQQQQQQLQQQLALLEQNHRDQLLLRLGAAGAPHSTTAAVHSAPLSPTTIHSADQTDQSSAVLTQILLSKLLGTSNNAVELPLQTPLPSLASTTKTSPPPASAQTQIPSLPSQFVAQQQMAAAELAEATALLLGSSEGGISGNEGGSREAMGAADLALQQLGPLLLQQLHQQRQQQQREEENAPITAMAAQQQQMAAAAAQIVQAVQQQQIQQALVVVENSEPELAVV